MPRSDALPTIAAPDGTPIRPSLRDVRFRLQGRVIDGLDLDTEHASRAAVEAEIRRLLEAAMRDEDLALALDPDEADRLMAQVVDEIIGLGPIEPLLIDPTVSEVMVNGAARAYLERDGRLVPAHLGFRDDEHVMRMIDRIIAPLGRRVDESSPMVDARLADGSRVNAIIPPLSLVGPILTIRKFAATPLTVPDLVRSGTATPDMFEFLRGCVEARLNIIVSGGTGSGKTTLLNVLSSFIGSDERIVTIEDAAELQLRQEHVLTLESRPPNIEGKGGIAIRELVRNALRMRPDRIVVGEVRAAESIDMLQAMNTGHDGSMSTVHANGPRDALRRLETMVLMSGLDLPLRAIREQVSSAIDLVVHTARLKDGSRKITRITEVQDMEGDVVVMQDIFEFHQTGVVDGRVLGQLRPTGIRPRLVEEFEAHGIEIPPYLFGDYS